MSLVCQDSISPRYLRATSPTRDVFFPSFIQKGRGTGPVKPWQPPNEPIRWKGAKSSCPHVTPSAAEEDKEARR